MNRFTKLRREQDKQWREFRTNLRSLIEPCKEVLGDPVELDKAHADFIDASARLQSLADQALAKCEAVEDAEAKSTKPPKRRRPIIKRGKR